MTTLENFIRNKGIKTPVVFEIGLDRLSNRNDPRGNQLRYFRFFINGMDVTGMVANALGTKVSKAKDTYGCIIRKGCGMDIALGTIWALRKTTTDQNLYAEDYKYLGKKVKGKYENVK